MRFYQFFNVENFREGALPSLSPILHHPTSPKGAETEARLLGERLYSNQEDNPNCDVI
jgi:hypothetical protein